jgi:hypothetical protein
MRRLASTLAGRRLLPIEAATRTIAHETRTRAMSKPKSPACPIDRHRSCGLLGMYRAGPPLGLSRDLLIRTLAHELQQRAHGGPSLALRRRLQSLAGASEKGTVDPDIVLKAGTTLVRQWRGHTHTVLVHNDGFEHEGQLYRSLTAIADRITETHWSGPRFFGLTKRASALAGAKAGR